MSLVLFIVNPIAGKRNKFLVIREIKHFCAKNNIDYDIFYTTGNRTDSYEYIKKHFDKDLKAVVAVGGDGTINEVAKAIVNTNVPLLIIPKGSGNGMARHLKMLLPTKDILQALINGRVINYDVGYLNDQIFLCNAGFGFDAYLANYYSHHTMRKFLPYIFAGIKALISYKPHRYTLKLQVESSNVIFIPFLLTFSNINQYGYGITINPKARTDDGKLDVAILRPFKWYNVPHIVFLFLRKQLDKSKFHTIIRISSCNIESRTKEFYHIDGEPFESTDTVFNIRVEKGALRCLLPEKSNYI
ncbi:MAG: diacylglycerol kinase family lipid kinase [Bacteroidales bacterium]|jgi:YegS/Rv2252/BmrU family lipid kinase|nr:diacylglycerol kinase family lipid kinase [Bacteroidales bacterium]